MIDRRHDIALHEKYRNAPMLMAWMWTECRRGCPCMCHTYSVWRFKKTPITVHTQNVCHHHDIQNCHHTTDGLNAFYTVYTDTRKAHLVAEKVGVLVQWHLTTQPLSTKATTKLPLVSSVHTTYLSVCTASTETTMRRYHHWYTILVAMGGTGSW